MAAASGIAMRHRFTFRPDGTNGDGAHPGGGLTEDRLIRGIHPQNAERLQIDRLREFDLTRLASADEEIYLFKAVAKSNKADERLIAMGQVRDLTPLREADGRLVALPALENVLAGCLDAIRTVQAQRPQHKRFDANRIMIYVWPTVDLTAEEINSLVRRIRPTTSGAGLEEVQFVTRQRTPSGELAEVAIWTSLDASHAVRLHMGPPPTEPLLPFDDYRQKVLRAARRGNVYPYELTDLLAGQDGRFEEHDLDETGALVAGGPAEGKEHRGHRRRRRHDADRPAPRGRHPRGAARRPGQVARRAGGTRVRPGDRGARPGPAPRACPSSGSRCRPARASR